MFTTPPICVCIVNFFIDISVKFHWYFREISLKFWRNISLKYHWNSSEISLIYWNFNEIYQLFHWISVKFQRIISFKVQRNSSEISVMIFSRVLHTMILFFTYPFYFLLVWLKYGWNYSKWWRPWLDATLYGIWSGSALFAQACMSEFLG